VQHGASATAATGGGGGGVPPVVRVPSASTMAQAAAMSAADIAAIEARARQLEEEKMRLEAEKRSLERSVRDMTATTANLQSSLLSAEEARARMQAQLNELSRCGGGGGGGVRSAASSCGRLGDGWVKARLRRRESWRPSTLTAALCTRRIMSSALVLCTRPAPAAACSEEGDLLKERQLRKRLERKLQIAEESLRRLDSALRRNGVKLDVDVFADVRTLREFFEER
jgi:hypothetical protein